MASPDWQMENGDEASTAGGLGLQKLGSFAREHPGGQELDPRAQPRRNQASAPKRARCDPALGAAERPARSVSGVATAHPPHDQASDSPGQGHTALAPRNNIPLLFQLQREGRGLAPDVESRGGMASKDATGIIVVDDAPETEALSNASERDHQPGAATDGSCGALSAPASSHPERDSSPGQDHTIQAVGPIQQAAQGLSQDPSESAQDVPDADRDAGPLCGLQPCATIPCLAVTTPNPGDNVEAADVHASRCSIPSAPSPGLFPGLDTGGHQPQAPQPSSKSDLSHLGDEPGGKAQQGQGQGEGQEQDRAAAAAHQEGDDLILSRTQIITILLALVLENPNNLCYANAALFALVWTMISMNQYHSALWGDCRSDLMHFLCSASDGTGNLIRADFYDQILRSLGATESYIRSGTISQQDSAEYVQLWLKRMRTTAFDMRWEKRCEVATATRVMDFNHECHTPLCLKFDAITVQCSLCHITTLARSWHQVDGMRSALLSSSPCVCIHLDRCTIGPDLAVYKCDSKLQCDDECLLPVFQDAHLSIDFESYSITAMMSHLGGDGCGHYRAAIRVKPMVLGLTQPIEWVLTDDWRPPEPVWSPPTWMLENATMIWMVRTDLLDTPSYLPPVTHASDSIAALMQMFASEPEHQTS